MPSVEKAVWKTAKGQLLYDNAMGLPAWEAFRLGAARDMPQICCLALHTLDKTHTVEDICHRSHHFYQDLPSRYLATLLTDTYFMKDGSYRQHTLIDIAERFNVMRKGEDQ
jgi:hypothetical protein